jgi:hypothetical protein
MARLSRLVCVLVVLGLAASSTADARGHSVRVFHGSQAVFAFHTAECVKKKDIFTAVLGGEYKSPKYAMAVRIEGFSGFKDYPVTLGPSLGAGSVSLKLFGPRNAVYSNFYKPPFPSPGAGHVKFTHHGHLMGVGFGPAMYTRDASDAVLLTGVVKCKYPRKKRRRRA